MASVSVGRSTPPNRCCWEWTGGRAFMGCLGPMCGWESRGKEHLKAPVDCLNYQIVLLSQKLILGFKFQVAMA